MIVARAVAGETDPAMGEIADYDPGDPGDGDGSQRRGRACFRQHVIDRLAADGDQQADHGVADELLKSGAGLGVRGNAVEMLLHRFSRASIDALAMAIGLTSAGGISRTAARRNAQAISPPMVSGRSSGTRVASTAADNRSCPALLA